METIKSYRQKALKSIQKFKSPWQHADRSRNWNDILFTLEKKRTVPGTVHFQQPSVLTLDRSKS